MLDTKLQSEEFKFYFFFFLALTFLFAMLMPFSYSDLAIWIAEGRQIMRQGTVYISDAYSFNQTQAFPYPWLSCVLYYFIDLHFGIDAIFFIHRLIPVLIVAFWLKKFPQLLHKSNWLTLVIGISGLSMLIVDRPALLILPFVPLVFDLIENKGIYKNKVKTLLLLTLWTNLHGSFPLFLILLAYSIFWTYLKLRSFEQLKKEILYLISCIAVTLINPWGIKIYSYVFETASISKMRMTEWQPFAFFDQNKFSFGMLFFVMTIVLLAIATVRKKKVHALISSSFFIFIFSSFAAIRNVPLFFSVLPLFWGKNFAETRNVIGISVKSNLPQVFVNRAITTVLIVCGCFMFSSYSEILRQDLPDNYARQYDSTATFQIADYLNQHPGKRVFNSWVLGSFLIYSQPNKIFIDTRNIIYSGLIFRDYINVQDNIHGQSEALLNQYQIDYVVSEKVKAVANVLRMSQNWTFIMEDNNYMLFERK